MFVSPRLGNLFFSERFLIFNTTHDGRRLDEFIATGLLVVSRTLVPLRRFLRGFGGWERVLSRGLGIKPWMRKFGFRSFIRWNVAVDPLVLPISLLIVLA
jgi:hypothetical protein